MIEEIGVMERQAKIAEARGDAITAARLRGLLDIVGLAMGPEPRPAN